MEDPGLQDGLGMQVVQRLVQNRCLIKVKSKFSKQNFKKATPKTLLSFLFHFLNINFNKGSRTHLVFSQEKCKRQTKGQNTASVKAQGWKQPWGASELLGPCARASAAGMSPHAPTQHDTALTSLTCLPGGHDQASGIPTGSEA